MSTLFSEGADVMIDRERDEVQLSERERQALMEIEAQLAEVHCGLGAEMRRLLEGLPGWLIAAFLAVGGVTVIVAAFSESLALALGGSVILGVAVVVGCLRAVPGVKRWCQDEPPPQ